MRIHALFHAPFEKLGVIKHWIHQHQHTLTTTHAYRKEKVPHKDEFDFLLIMGGPQSLCCIDEYPYLKEEIELTQQAIAHKKAVLGICLGAQIIGAALGAKTEKSPNREVGIYPVTLTQEGEKDPLLKHFPKTFDVLHWHSDMPGMHKDAVLLATSEGCPRQAFRYGDHVYGFQFHLEMDNPCIEAIAENCKEDLRPDKYIQTLTQLRNHRYEDINQKMVMALDYLAGKISTQPYS